MTKHVVTISKRRYESLLRAEALAQEVRYQFADNRRSNPNRLSEFCLKWMKITGKRKYERTDL